MRSHVKSIVFLAVLVMLDQWSKYVARVYLAQVATVPILSNFLHLTYVENRGAAFGIMQGQSMLLGAATAVAIASLLVYYNIQKNNQGAHITALRFIVLTIIAGAIGNLIDRIWLGFVTDFIDFRGIWQFVFNIADIYVVCAILLLGAYIVKFDKSNE